MRQWAYHVGCGGRVVDPDKQLAGFLLLPGRVAACLGCMAAITSMEQVTLSPAPAFIDRCRTCGTRHDDEHEEQCPDCRWYGEPQKGG